MSLQKLKYNMVKHECSWTFIPSRGSSHERLHIYNNMCSTVTCWQHVNWLFTSKIDSEKMCPVSKASKQVYHQCAIHQITIRGSRHFCTDQVHIKRQQLLSVENFLKPRHLRTETLLGLWINVDSKRKEKKRNTCRMHVSSSRGHGVRWILNFLLKLRSYLRFPFLFFLMVKGKCCYDLRGCG